MNSEKNNDTSTAAQMVSVNKDNEMIDATKIEDVTDNVAVENVILNVVNKLNIPKTQKPLKTNIHSSNDDLYSMLNDDLAFRFSFGTVTTDMMSPTSGKMPRSRNSPSFDSVCVKTQMLGEISGIKETEQKGTEQKETQKETKQKETGKRYCNLI